MRRAGHCARRNGLYLGMTKSGYLVTGAPHALSLQAFETQTIRFWTRVQFSINLTGCKVYGSEKSRRSQQGSGVDGPSANLNDQFGLVVCEYRISNKECRIMKFLNFCATVLISATDIYANGLFS